VSGETWIKVSDYLMGHDDPMVAEAGQVLLDVEGELAESRMETRYVSAALWEAKDALGKALEAAEEALEGIDLRHLGEWDE